MAYDFNSLTKQADEASNRDKFYTDFEDVDPNKLHQISELTSWMRTKAKGSDVREIIAQLFERTWLENIKEGNANMEVSLARGSYPNLKSRLDNVDKKQQQTSSQLAEKANKDEVTNVMTPKGNIAYASLPMTGNSVGWYYYCPDGDGTHGAGNYVWNGTSWFFGGTGDEGYNLLKSDLACKVPLGLIGNNLLFECKYVDNKYWNTGEYDSDVYGYFEMNVTSGVTYYIKPFARFISSIVDGVGTILSENAQTFTPIFSGKVYITFSKTPMNLEWIVSTNSNFDDCRSYNKPFNHRDFFAHGLGDSDSIAISQKAIKENCVSKKIANIFDYSTSRNGYLSDNTGAVTSSDIYETSDYIKVYKGKSIVFNKPIRKLLSFNEDKATRGFVLNERVEKGYVFTPDVNGFIMFTYWVEDKYTFMVEYGTEPSKNYYPYNEYVLENGILFNDELSAYVNKNVLYGKKYVSCGDSFTEGDFTGADFNYKFTDGDYFGKNIVYPYIIGVRNRMEVVNEAKSGSTITDTANNSFSHSGGRYTQIPSDADYITLKFGINDWHVNCPIGTIDDTTNTTFYGAWNVVMEYLITNHPTAKIGIIITNGLNGDGGEEYAEAERAIAKKWGVPYLDEDKGEQVGLIFRSNRTDVNDIVKNLRFNEFKVSDTNGHPNVKCHEYESTIVENWLRSL